MELNITNTMFDTPSARGCIAEAVAGDKYYRTEFFAHHASCAQCGDDEIKAAASAKISELIAGGSGAPVREMAARLFVARESVRRLQSERDKFFQYLLHIITAPPTATADAMRSVASQAIHGCYDRDDAAVRVQAEIAGMREAIDILQDCMELLYSNAAESPEWVRERINLATDAAARAMRVTDPAGGK